MSDYPEFVFLNGEILATNQAKISVFDRGFIFGDGIYEVLNTVNGTFFYKKAHLDRLQSGLHKINIELPESVINNGIDTIINQIDITNQDYLLYIQVTRGVAPRKHSYPKKTTPTVMMYVLPFSLPEINNKKIETVTHQDFRWHRCDIKMTSLLGNVMANEFAIKNNAYETILIRNGYVTEASHCNVFFVAEDTVYTHPANEFILNGIVRQIVVKLCHELQIELIERAIHEDEIPKMTEAFLTGTTTQVAAIQAINGSQVSKQTIGPITKKLQSAFLTLKTNSTYV